MELTGSIKALLDEYKRAINELVTVIEPIDDDTLCRVVDENATDPDCKSIQTVLAHVVCSGYGYTVAVETRHALSLRQPPQPQPQRILYPTTNQYIQQLTLMFDYCENFFKSNPNLEIQETDNSKKITVNWGQQYDIEQLLEHAIVHILRHRRQIEKFLESEKFSR